MNKAVRLLQQKKAEVAKKMREMLDAAAAADSDLTAEQQAEYDSLVGKLASLNAMITRETSLAAVEAQLGVLEVADSTRITGGEPALEQDDKRGFRSFADFARAVKEEGPNLSNPKDERLRIAAATPSTVGNEISGADGGFLVPPAYAQEIFTYALEQDSLLPLTDNITVGGNSMVFPKDETVPWGTDGVRTYWQAEAAAGTQVKPKLSTTILRLYKIMALVPITDELLEDTNALDGYLPRKTGESMRWKINESIMWGSGVGQPLGAFNGNAVVTVAKETSQATLTLLIQNLAKMLARLPDQASMERAQWFINNDVLPAVIGLNNAAPGGATGSFPVWLQTGVISGVQVARSPGFLFTRPVNVTQHAKSFTNQGDVLLLDPYYVRSISKDAIKTATSMHLYFDADAMAFRTTFRVDAQPKIVNPIAPYNGSNNLSPFVQLGTR